MPCCIGFYVILNISVVLSLSLCKLSASVLLLPFSLVILESCVPKTMLLGFILVVLLYFAVYCSGSGTFDLL